MTPELYRVFLWKVLHMAIDTMDCFYVKMKFSEHEHNSQLSYPDHPGNPNVKL